jgi:hypothetical protein
MKIDHIDFGSAVSRLMARENLDIVYSDHVHTAYCDPMNRKLIFPTKYFNLSYEILSIFSAHEVSHALHSPRNISEIFKQFGNHVVMVFEDIRIENLIKKEFPGLGPIFDKGYRQLVEEHDFFGLKKHSVNVESLSLLDRINLKAKIGHVFDVPLSSEEMEFYNRINKAKSWDDLIPLIEEYNSVFKNKEEAKQENNSDFYDYSPDNIGDQSDSNSDSYDENDQTCDYSPNSNGNKSENESESESENESDDGESTEENNSVKKGGSSDMVDSKPSSSSDNLEVEEGFTDKQSENWMKDFENPDIHGTMISIPSFKDVQSRIISWKELEHHRNLWKKSWSSCNPKSKNSVVKSTKKLVDKFANIMVMDFMSKKSAMQNVKIKLSKSGELDTNKLVDYRYSDNIFRRGEIVPNDKNHGMIIFVDYSGSMSPIMTNVLFQIAVLVTFCNRVNIPFEVYGFSDGYLHGKRAFDNIFAANNLNLLNLFSSKMSKKEFNDALNAFSTIIGKKYYEPLSDLESLYGTPLNITRLASISLTKQFIKEHQVQKPSVVYLTDGYAGDYFGYGRYLYDNKVFNFEPADNSTKYSSNWSQTSTSHKEFPEFYLAMFKSIFPHIPVVNFFLGGHMFLGKEDSNRQEKLNKTGVLTFDRSNEKCDYFIERYLPGFDAVHYITMGNSGIVAQQKATKSIKGDSFDTTTALYDSFVKSAFLGKKSNAISREFMSIFA